MDPTTHSVANPAARSHKCRIYDRGNGTGQIGVPAWRQTSHPYWKPVHVFSLSDHQFVAGLEVILIDNTWWLKE